MSTCLPISLPNTADGTYEILSKMNQSNWLGAKCYALYAIILSTFNAVSYAIVGLCEFAGRVAGLRPVSGCKVLAQNLRDSARSFAITAALIGALAISFIYCPILQKTHFQKSETVENPEKIILLNNETIAKLNCDLTRTKLNEELLKGQLTALEAQCDETQKQKATELSALKRTKNDEIHKLQNLLSDCQADLDAASEAIHRRKNQFKPPRTPKPGTSHSTNQVPETTPKRGASRSTKPLPAITPRGGASRSRVAFGSGTERP